ncbi:MAG: hypothetical protein KIS92_01995 [Planctomycetota bacterium]|nr:hypothetical protein [Planctomycetota bacterium]
MRTAILVAWVLAAAGTALLQAEEKPAMNEAQAPAPVAPESEWARKMDALRRKLQGGEVLLRDAFDREALGDDWVPEEGTWKTGGADGGVTGTPGTKYPDSFLWTKQSFKGDLVVEFEAECLSAPAHDINVVLNGRAPNYPDEKPMYLMGVGGWDNTQSGIERAPEYKLKALTELFTIEKARVYKVLAARLGSKLYLFVDGKLIVSAGDPDPLPAEGQVALHVYKSTVKFRNVVIRRPAK